MVTSATPCCVTRLRKRKAQTDLQQRMTCSKTLNNEPTVGNFKSRRKESELSSRRCCPSEPVWRKNFTTLWNKRSLASLCNWTRVEGFEVKPETRTIISNWRAIWCRKQVDVQRSVWDLRSRALEQFDLPGALVASSNNSRTARTSLESCKGRVRPCPKP